MDANLTMAKRVPKRCNHWWWRGFEIIGWAMIVLGTLFLGYSLDSAARARGGPADDPLAALTAFASLLLGVMLAFNARRFDTRWTCSSCKKPLRANDSASCLNCMVVLE